MSPQWIVFGALLFYGIQNETITVTHLVGLGVILVSGFIFLIYRFQSNLLYQPRVHPTFITPSSNPPGYRSPSEHNCPYEDVYLETSDGIRLHSWFIRPPSLSDRLSRPTALFFHANAGNIGFRLDNLSEMYHRYKMNIFILEYRGYGESDGAPSEDGILIDGETAFQYVCGRNDVDKKRIFLFGRSLGGGVAIALGATHSDSLGGIIVENTFTSISALADCLFPYLRFLKKFLLKLKWTSIDRIRKVTAPMLFLCGQIDEIVPHHHMLQLFDASSSKDKVKLIIPRGTHNTTWQEGGEEYRRVFVDFVTNKSHVAKNEEPKASMGWRVIRVNVHDEKGDEGKGLEHERPSSSPSLTSGTLRPDVVLGSKPIAAL